MCFDYMSDVHLDFWVKMTGNEQKLDKNMLAFVQALLPENPQDTLLVAGDIGHYPAQNHRLFLYLREVYETIFYVYGNHDYYLLSSKMKKRYRHSLQKASAMDELFLNIDGVKRLDATTVDVGGIRYGGADMWYDLCFNQADINHEAVYQEWWEDFNDRVFQVGLPHPHKHAQKEMEKVKNLECDVFMSHVPPFGMPIPQQYMTEKELPFYTFDASSLFVHQKPSVWVSGHMHQNRQATVNGIQCVVNAIGYPENRHQQPPKIATYSPSPKTK